jgi:hypothetical protein
MSAYCVAFTNVSLLKVTFELEMTQPAIQTLEFSCVPFQRALNWTAVTEDSFTMIFQYPQSYLFALSAEENRTSRVASSGMKWSQCMFKSGAGQYSIAIHVVGLLK